MGWHGWLGFTAASLAMGLVPGPGVMSIVGYAVSSGRKVALASVFGMAFGNAAAMSLSLAGVGVLLAASALAFSLLKAAGALYLVGLGLAAIWRSRAGFANACHPPIGARAAFVGTLAVGLFHPKTITFFVAFVPQFISADAAFAPQAALLIATFCLVVAGTDALYALTASRLVRRFRDPRAVLWSKRAGGGVLIASGLVTAAARR